MPPITQGSRGRGIPNADANACRGRGGRRGRGRGQGRGQARQEMLGDEIPHVEEQGGFQAEILQQILECLDGIEARNNNIPIGGENAQKFQIPNANQALVENLVIRTQLKDLSKLKGPYFYGIEAGNEAEAWLLNIDRCFILHDYHTNVKVCWTAMQLRSFASIWWEMELENLGLHISKATWELFLERFWERFMSEFWHQTKSKEFFNIS